MKNVLFVMLCMTACAVPTDDQEIDVDIEELNISEANNAVKNQDFGTDKSFALQAALLYANLPVQFLPWNCNANSTNALCATNPASGAFSVSDRIACPGGGVDLKIIDQATGNKYARSISSELGGGSLLWHINSTRCKPMADGYDIARGTLSGLSPRGSLVNVFRK